MEIKVMESKVLGDYTIIKQIGQGSLGMVFLAEHRYMKRQHVIKVLPEELASDRSFIQRFEEDVALLSSLDHPNIVKLHNISFAQGQYFLVADCVVDEVGETTNLAQYLFAHGNRLDEMLIWEILQQIGDALDYAHGKKTGGKGIAHRNLKLNNILIGKKRTGNIEVAISDFGLSRIIGTGAVLTRTFKSVAEGLGIVSVLGGPKSVSERYPNPPLEAQKLNSLHISFLQNFAFLAPEQKRGDAAKAVDSKADVYAFGVLAYYLLMREFPEGYIELPSKRFPEYMKGWDKLLMACLQSDPSKRPELIFPLLESVKEPAKGFVQMQFPIFEEEINVEQKSYQQGLKPVINSGHIERPVADMDPASVFQIDSTVKHYTPELKEVKNTQPLHSEMVVIQGGPFERGSNDGNRDEMPRHQIILNSFAMDVHPVTNEQFVRFLEVMGGEKDSNHQDIIRLRDSRIKRSGGRLSIESGYAKHPVVGVTWYGSMAYAKWIGKRLPTEAEWEIASYGGKEGALYPSGEDIEKTQANFFSSDTTAVMSYAPNGFGLYDLAGNVYEWCYDWYGYNFYEASIQEPENPHGPLQGVYRVLRGGCWKSLREDLRCSRRHRNNPGTVNGTYGFRCAADVQ